MLKYDELHITVPAIEGYDSEKNEFFIISHGTTIVLKHSLISIAKWERKWHVPFLGSSQKTTEQIMDYIQCMTISPGWVNPEVYKRLTDDDFKEIMEYIENPMTATTFYDPFAEEKKQGKRQIQTAETIYADMISLQMPIEFQKWHLNSLLTLIRVCAEKQSPPEKISPEKQAAYYSKIRAQKRAARAAKGKAPHV